VWRFWTGRWHGWVSEWEASEGIKHAGCGTNDSAIGVGRRGCKSSFFDWRRQRHRRNEGQESEGTHFDVSLIRRERKQRISLNYL